jgi:hypothetical protein
MVLDAGPVRLPKADSPRSASRSAFMANAAADHRRYRRPHQKHRGDDERLARTIDKGVRLGYERSKQSNTEDAAGLSCGV